MDEKLQQQIKHQADAAARQKPITGRSALIGVLILLVAATLIAVFGILPRVRAEKTLAADTNRLAAPDVIANAPQAGAPVLDVVLPGNIYAYTDSPIYARTDGYLLKWYYDIGAHVRKGTLLAVISTPELDKQLLQARADLVTAKTNSKIADITANRYKDLLPTSAVSKEQTDTAASTSEASASSVQAAQANVERLEKLQSFEKIYAPFDGVITARNIDIGQLITAGSDGGAGSQLFHMAAVNTLRVYVAVPQAYGGATKPGMIADLTFNEYPGKSFPARIVRTAKYIDPASRTLLVEVDYDNRKNLLTPGSYTAVHFHLKSGAPTLMVPTSALMFRSEGLRIATVVHAANGETVARLIPVILGDDDGKIVQVVHGLDSTSQVIQNPPDSIIDNEPVNVVQPQPQQGSGGKA
ncbi:MAG: efflux RND transporter periplasmic adaptor subunit [Acidobacteria bacterium]|nr:efflux RND transporter periplasmic adaptor subunit [Acidobacteriota bacterium]